MKALVLGLVLTLVAGAAVAGSRIHLTAPQLSALTVQVNGQPYALTTSELQAINDNLVSGFLDIETALNQNTFSHLGGLDQLAKAFANANAATADNASLGGFQNYDAFALVVGFNLGLAVPTLDPVGALVAIDDVATTGDLYAGAATGGVAAQVGVNLGPWVPGLYANARFGSVPSLSLGGIGFQQVLVGAGVNYTLVRPYNFFYGLFQWRGLSAGTGLVYNTSTAQVAVKVPDQSSGDYSVVVTDGASSATLNYSAQASEIRAQLTVNHSSLVVPFDLTSSVQVLWFLNLGVDLGLDLAFSGSRVTLDGSSQLSLSGLDGAQVTPGAVALSAVDTRAGGDVFLPRIGASVGLDLTALKVNVPVTYYPLSKTVAVGIVGGVVW